MLKLNDKTYHAAIYLRLSQEDGDISVSDKNESNSISTQRDLIQAFLRKQADILYEAEFCDDGYTGTNFDRPGFTDMMKAVREKRVDCIIVKDLSRFGRDYIESGKYIQKIFPMLGVRFIAINDGYDSADTENQSNDFVLPFKNLINDSYCRDISIKSRSNLEVKRRNGEFVGNFAVFGYMRSPDDKHKLMELDVEKFNNIKMELYEDLKSDLITKEEYHSFKNDYDIRIQSIRQQIAEFIIVLIAAESSARPTAQTSIIPVRLPSINTTASVPVFGLKEVRWKKFSLKR